MPVFSTYTTNIPDGTTLKITSGKIGLNLDDMSIKYGSYGKASNQVYTPACPVGGVIAWCKNIPGVPALPDCFVECNGQVLSDADSPLNGETIPDLNGSVGTQRFLMGGTTSGTTGGSATLPNHTHPITQGRDNGNTNIGASINNTSTTGNPSSNPSTLPPYYEVVWIMRIK